VIVSILSDETPPGVGVEVHGPFLPEHLLTLDGFKVPYFTVQPTEDGKFWLTLDHRFGMHAAVTAEELDNWLPILTHAMAIAAGYACFGENPPRLNLFNCRMSSLGSVRPGLTVIDGDKKKSDDQSR
jgi:hypothetical protein